MVNKQLSQPLWLKRGVRQGDPLSCLLFNVVIEGFANMVRNDMKLKGILDSNNIEYKISLFADDTALIFTDLNQWSQAKKLYTTYHKATTAKLNEEKTVILTVNDSNRRTNIGRIKILLDGNADYLGVPIGSELDYRVWLKKHQEIEGAIKQWRLNFLSIRQRVAVARTALAAKLWHLLRCFLARQEDLDPIQRTIWRYVWEQADSSKATGPIANAQALRPIEEGGLKMIDIRTMQRTLLLYWIKALEKGSEDLTARPLWYQVTIDLILEPQPIAERSMITRPWKQIWAFRIPQVPPAIASFWTWWIRNCRSRTKRPESREELNASLFWYHPSLAKERQSINWGAQVWRDMNEGNDLPEPITTVTQIWELSQDEPTTQHYQKAAQRAVAKFPRDWIEILQQ